MSYKQDAIKREIRIWLVNYLLDELKFEKVSNAQIKQTADELYELFEKYI